MNKLVRNQTNWPNPWDRKNQYLTQKEHLILSSKRPHLIVLSICLPLLSACFVSERSLIPTEEAVLPVDGELTLCTELPDKCFTMTADGDQYVTAAEYTDGPPAVARFSLLTQIEGRQIYLLEIHNTDDATFTYLVAKRRDEDAAGNADMDLAYISCSDLNEFQRESFVAAGGVVRFGWSATCVAPDIATLKATVRDVYSDSISDNTWWSEGGAE